MYLVFINIKIVFYYNFIVFYILLLVMNRLFTNLRQIRQHGRRFLSQSVPEQPTTLTERLYGMIKTDLDNRQKKYLKWFGGVAGIGGGVLWYFYPQLSQKTVKIASKTLADQKVHKEAYILATETLSALVNDSNTKNVINDFVVESISYLSDNPKVQADLSHLIINALNTNEVKEVTKQLVIDLFKDETIRTSLEKLVVDVAQRKEIEAGIAELIKNSLIEVLHSEDFQKTADEEVSGVLYRLFMPRWLQKKEDVNSK